MSTSEVVTRKDLENILNEVLPIVERSDYIIEQGTIGIWTYRKWHSGIAECWGNKAWTVSNWTAWGSVYYSTYSGTENYPSGLFTSSPVLYWSGLSPSNDCWVGVTGTGDATKTASYYLLRPTNGSTSIQAYIEFHAIGRWK